MGKILPIIFALIGVGAGIGAGVMLKSEHKEDVVDCVPRNDDSQHITKLAVPDEHGDSEEATTEFVKMHNQFVIPVVDDGKMAALVVLSISIEVMPGGKEATFQREPKLRDAFNQVLFDHANSGGFDGVFTNSNKMVTLKNSLFEIARKVAGPVVKDVLIAELVRQDI